jgi:hypothetical protein
MMTIVEGVRFQKDLSEFYSRILYTKYEMYGGYARTVEHETCHTCTASGALEYAVFLDIPIHKHIYIDKKKTLELPSGPRQHITENASYL